MVCGPGVYQKETGYLFYKTVGPILKTIFINLEPDTLSQECF